MIEATPAAADLAWTILGHVRREDTVPEQAWKTDYQRNMKQRVVQRKKVLKTPMIAEIFAMIRSDDEKGIIQELRLLQKIIDLTQHIIQIGNISQVEQMQCLELLLVQLILRQMEPLRNPIDRLDTSHFLCRWSHILEISPVVMRKVGRH